MYTDLILQRLQLLNTITLPHVYKSDFSVFIQLVFIEIETAVHFELHWRVVLHVPDI